MTHMYVHVQSLQRAIQLGAIDNSASKVADSYSLLIDVVSKQEDRMEDALELCETAITIYPFTAKFHAAKSFILLKLNRTLESITASREAVRRDPSLPNGHYNLGMGYMKLGDKHKAEKAFRDMLVCDPNSTHGWLHLGVVLAGSAEREKLNEAQT